MNYFNQCAGAGCMNELCMIYRDIEWLCQECREGKTYPRMYVQPPGEVSEPCESS